MASMVASTRGSVAGRNPTIGIMRLEASRSSEPKYCVKAPAAAAKVVSSTIALSR